jgi:hypothetical protein
VYQHTRDRNIALVFVCDNELLQINYSQQAPPFTIDAVTIQQHKTVFFTLSSNYFKHSTALSNAIGTFPQVTAVVHDKHAAQIANSRTTPRSKFKYCNVFVVIFKRDGCSNGDETCDDSGRVTGDECHAV